MPNSHSNRNESAVFVWLALGIAVIAFGLRLSLTNFAIGSHPDEAIIGTLTERSADEGILTANWAGFGTRWWSRPTYQFSPYTLVQSALAQLVHWFTHSPSSLDGYIQLARVSSCFWGGLAVLLVFFLGRMLFSPGAALWGEAILAMCFLHIQDSIYARGDSFLTVLSSCP